MLHDFSYHPPSIPETLKFIEILCRETLGRHETSGHTSVSSCSAGYRLNLFRLRETRAVGTLCWRFQHERQHILKTGTRRYIVSSGWVGFQLFEYQNSAKKKNIMNLNGTDGNIQIYVCPSHFEDVIWTCFLKQHGKYGNNPNFFPKWHG